MSTASDVYTVTATENKKIALNCRWCCSVNEPLRLEITKRIWKVVTDYIGPLASQSLRVATLQPR